MNSSRLIRVHRDGEDYGPFSPQQAVELISAGNLVATDLPWHEGLTDWQPLDSIAACQSAFQPPSAESANPTSVLGNSGTRLRLVKPEPRASAKPVPLQAKLFVRERSEFEKNRDNYIAGSKFLSGLRRATRTAHRIGLLIPSSPLTQRETWRSKSGWRSYGTGVGSIGFIVASGAIADMCYNGISLLRMLACLGGLAIMYWKVMHALRDYQKDLDYAAEHWDDYGR